MAYTFTSSPVALPRFTVLPPVSAPAIPVTLPLMHTSHLDLPSTIASASVTCLALVMPWQFLSTWYDLPPLVQYTSVPAVAQQVGQAFFPASSAFFSGPLVAFCMPLQSDFTWK